MLNTEHFRQLLYYFVKLPLFSRRLRIGSFSGMEEIGGVCPDAPKRALYHDAIVSACRRYPFLEGHSPESLYEMYYFVSTVRESDVFLYPFLSRKSVARFNEFHNMETLHDAYKKGPVLVLYAHTGSYYEVMAATGALGYRIYPVAYNIDPSALERPFRWLLKLNMKLSERHFSGGNYLYTGTPVFLQSLKRIISASESSLVYAAIDLSQHFITEKRLKVNFLDGVTTFPHKFVDLYSKSGLPILTAFPYIEVIDGRVKRVVDFQRVPDSLSTPDIVQYYAYKLDEFTRKKPEQLLNLINLGDFFV